MVPPNPKKAKQNNPTRMPKYVSIEKRGVALSGRWIIATIANAKLERAVPIWILATLPPLSKIEKGCAWGKNRTSVMLPTISVRVDKVRAEPPRR